MTAHSTPTPTSTPTSAAAPIRGRVVDLGQPWSGIGPFLFVAHHDDAYPRGTAAFGPLGGTDGRALGQDFSGRDGWSMYHGLEVPGFPAHPHRGFETITLVRKGHIDHADSTGASARYGAGDVQWVTAGSGVSHSEMFPLLDQEGPNPLELYQVWLNLPAASKGADAEFVMMWREDVPVVLGDGSRVTVVAGAFGDAVPLSPPVASWASDERSDLALWLVELDAGASVELPAMNTPDTQRMLYVHGGGELRAASDEVRSGQGFEQYDRDPLRLTAGDRPVVVLVLQGVGLGEPVVQHGPFVMNTADEIRQAFADYQRTQFGGWDWPTNAPVHARDAGRFARFGDGREEHPGDR